MIDLRALQKRINSGVPNRALIAVLVPMFLIISSNVFPAIISSMENEEIQIISKVVAQLKEDEEGRNDNHSILPTPSTQDLIPSSPTPIDPIFTATSSTSKESSDTQAINQQQDKEGDDKMDAMAINAADPVHVVWRDAPSGNYDIFYKRDGVDFDPTTENLSNDDIPSLDPVIAVSGNNVHIVWEVFDGNSDIVYKRSTNGGATFSPTINLSDNPGSSTNPSIAISGNNVHVVWQDDTPGNEEILYRRSTNGGANFTDPIKNLSSNTGFSEFPSIAVSGNNVHVVWHDNSPGNFDILYRQSTNSGSTFPNIIKNLSSAGGNSLRPSVAVSGINVHVVWDDLSPGNNDIFYRRSLDNGNTFSNEIKNLSGNVGDSTNPSIAISGNNVHVVWDDDTPGNQDIFYRRSLDGGATFPNIIKNLSNNDPDSSNPAVTVSGNNVYVVWNDSTADDPEIVYRTSPDSGNTFPAFLTNLSANTSPSFAPAIAVS